MKKYFIPLFVLISVIFLFNGCNSKVNNEVTFQNNAMMGIYVNFMGTAHYIPSGSNKILTELPKGAFTYNTTYQIPSGAKSSSAAGEVSGTLNIRAGKRILILYSSSYLNGVYIISATVSSNEDEGIDTNP